MMKIWRKWKFGAKKQQHEQQKNIKKTFVITQRFISLNVVVLLLSRVCVYALILADTLLLMRVHIQSATITTSKHKKNCHKSKQPTDLLLAEYPARRLLWKF